MSSPTDSKHAARYRPQQKLDVVVHDPEANPLAVAEVLDAASSHEWRDWEVETLREYCRLGDDDQQQVDKVMAVQVGLTNPDIFDDWHLFHHCTIAYNHRRANFEWLDKPELPELAWACVVLRGLSPDHQFGPGIERYIGSHMLIGGLTFFPWTGGDGIDVCKDPHTAWSKGLIEDELCKVGAEVARRWKRGEIQELAPSDVDETDVLANQLRTVVLCQAYIRAQKPADPGAY